MLWSNMDIIYHGASIYEYFNVRRKWRRNLLKETRITEMCRCIVSRYNYARMSVVRASRIVRTRYFNENWLQFAATTLIVDGPKFLALESRCARARARDAEISRRTATRAVRRAVTRRCGRAFIFILENHKRRRALPRRCRNDEYEQQLPRVTVIANSLLPDQRIQSCGSFAPILFPRGIPPEKLWAITDIDRTAPNEILA